MSEQAGTGIEVRTGHAPLAFLFFLTRPVIVVDGTAHKVGWRGRYFFETGPGLHTVAGFWRFLFVRRAGYNSLDVNVGEGQVAAVKYRMPGSVFARGRLTASPLERPPSPVTTGRLWGCTALNCLEAILGAILFTVGIGLIAEARLQDSRAVESVMNWLLPACALFCVASVPWEFWRQRSSLRLAKGWRETAEPPRLLGLATFAAFLVAVAVVSALVVAPFLLARQGQPSGRTARRTPRVTTETPPEAGQGVPFGSVGEETAPVVRAAGRIPAAEAASLVRVGAERLRLAVRVDHRQGRALAFSPDGALLATANDDHTVRLWAVATGELVHTLNGHADSVNAVAFSPDGTVLASAGADMDDTVRVWSVADGKCLHVLRGHKRGIVTLAFTPDGANLVSGSHSEQDRLWRADDWQCLGTRGYRHGVLQLLMLPDGKRVVASHRGFACVRPITGDGETISIPDTQERLNTLSLSRDGSLLSLPDGNGGIRVWSLTDGKDRHRFKGHDGKAVYVAAFSPDGTRMASGGDDCAVRLWLLEGEKALGILGQGRKYMHKVAFSPDGATVASLDGDGMLYLWAAEPETAPR